MPLVTDGWSSCQVQLPAGIPERTWQHCGRCTEPEHYPPQPGHSEIGPRWSNPRSHPKGRMSSPHSSWGRPWHGKRSTCWCRADVGPNTYDWLGRSPERRSSAEHSFRQVGSPKEDRSEDTFWRACLQWGGLTDVVESTELHDSSESPISAFNAQGWEWGSPALCSPKSTLGCCSEWMS